MNKAVSYSRVSTVSQGLSGLGLDGQKNAIDGYCAANNMEIVREFVEIESGKNDARPELAKALAFARRAKAVLIVAKLDRLARSVAFVDGVMKSGVDFRAVDVPSANRLVLHILAAVAEAEAVAISERTRTALKVAKARGVPLGSHRQGHPALSAEALSAGRALGAATMRSKALKGLEDLSPQIVALRTQGATLQAIADALNADGQRTRGSAEWRPTQVARVLARAAA